MPDVVFATAIFGGGGGGLGEKNSDDKSNRCVFVEIWMDVDKKIV